MGGAAICVRGGGTMGLMEEMRVMEEMEKCVEGLVGREERKMEIEGYAYGQYRSGRVCTFN